MCLRGTHAVVGKHSSVSMSIFFIVKERGGVYLA